MCDEVENVHNINDIYFVCIPDGVCYTISLGYQLFKGNLTGEIYYAERWYPRPQKQSFQNLWVALRRF